MLKNVKIIDQDELTTELIHIGSKVQVKDVEFDEVCTYQIVGSSEADPSNGRISDESPVGKGACFGHKVGETVEIETPGRRHAVRNIRNFKVVQMRTGAARMHSVRFFKIIIGSCHYERRKDHSGK